MHNDDLVSRADVLDLVQSYGPATYDMPYGSGDMIIRPEDVMALPAVDAVPVVRCKDCKHYFPDYMNTIGGNVVVYRCELDHDYGRDDYFCADGERAETPTCGPDYCEIGGEDDADG